MNSRKSMRCRVISCPSVSTNSPCINLNRCQNSLPPQRKILVKGQNTTIQKAVAATSEIVERRPSGARKASMSDEFAVSSFFRDYSNHYCYRYTERFIKGQFNVEWNRRYYSKLHINHSRRYVRCGLSKLSSARSLSGSE